MPFNVFAVLSLLIPHYIANDESTCTTQDAVQQKAIGQSLLQVKRDNPAEGPPMPTECALPEGAAWCQVRLANLAPYWMAVYASGAGEQDKNNDWVSWNICHTGFWEDQDMSTFGTPGSMLDIGGNVGYHTFAFAHAGWTVHSFEPMAPNLAFQNATRCANPAFNEKVTTHPHGLGTSAQTCKMVAPKHNVGDGWTVCGTEGEQEPVDATVIGSFEVRRLDEVLKEIALPKIDVVKIDVEGYEAQVFAGAPKFFEKYHPRLIKSEVWAEMAGSSGGQYLHQFEHAGYKIYKDVGCTNATNTQAIGDVFICLQAQSVLQASAIERHSEVDDITPS